MKNLKYAMVVHPAKEGGFWASFPDLPGCGTQGETLEELREMAVEAVELYLSVLHDEGQEIPGGIQNGSLEILEIPNDPKTWREGVSVAPQKEVG